MSIKETKGSWQHARNFEPINQRAFKKDDHTAISIAKRLLRLKILLLNQHRIADIEDPGNFNELLDILVAPENAEVFADNYELQVTALNNPEFVDHIKNTFDKIIQAFNTHFGVWNNYQLVANSLFTASRIMESNSISLKFVHPPSVSADIAYKGYIADFSDEVVQILKEAGISDHVHLLVNFSQSGLSITMGTHNDTDILVLAEHSDRREEWQAIANFYKNLQRPFALLNALQTKNPPK